MQLGATRSTAPASAKRTKAAAATGGQGGASRKEKKGKHKGWLALPATLHHSLAPTEGWGRLMFLTRRAGWLTGLIWLMELPGWPVGVGQALRVAGK